MYAPSKVLKTAEGDRKCSHHSDGDKSWKARSGGESSKGRAQEAEASTTAKRLFTAFCYNSKQPEIEEIAGKKWRVEVK